MGNVFVTNKKVACTPLGKYRSIQMTGNTFKTVAQKSELLSLTVVYGNDDFNVGDVVYIKGDCMTLPWSKEEFSLGDTKFIFVPEDRIEMKISPGQYTTGPR